MKRYIAQSFQHQQRTIEKLIELGDLFEEHHSEYTELYVLIANCCAMTCRLIQRISILAWGYWPDDFHKWLR
jgi:hypothetical protein